jgi:hypothetical protein
MKKLSVLLLIAVFMSINVYAVQYYDDGQTHTINTPINDGISIYNANPNIGPSTTVNLQSGAGVPGAEIYDTSMLNVFSGSEIGVVRSYIESNFAISGGTAHDLELFHHSFGTMTGGRAYNVTVGDESCFSVSGGDIYDPSGAEYGQPGGIRTSENGIARISGGGTSRVISLGSSKVEMSDGDVATMNTHEYSTATITGGHVGQILAFGESQVTINYFMTTPQEWNVTTNDYSHASITGGQGFIAVQGNSVANISSANVQLDIQNNGQATVTDSHLSYVNSLYMNTSLNLINTTVNSGIRLFDTSRLTVSTGTSLDTISLRQNNTLTFSGGMAQSIGVAGNSLVEISGGNITEIGAIDYGTIEVTGGHIQILKAISGCQAYISGGYVDNIFADNASLFVINGFNFNYSYGYITDTYGTVTGTLLSGESVMINFERLGDAQILIIPEPATLLLFGLGTLALRRHRK